MAQNQCLILASALAILSWISSPSRVTSVGVNWGGNASHPLPAPKVVELLKANNISKVKLSDTNPEALESLSGSNIDVIAGIPNSLLKSLNSSFKAAKSWVHDNVARYVSSDGSRVRIEYIAVGDEPFLQSYGGQYIPFVVGAAANIQTALIKANLADKVKVVIPCSYDAFQSESGLPSKGHFRPDLNKTMAQLLTFITKHNSPFFASLSPFHLLHQNKNISLDFSLFKKATAHPLNDSHRFYNNSFDLSYDTLITALSSVGFPIIDVVIGQIGWPTDGAVDATTSNAEKFMAGLLNHLRSRSGTPLRPQESPKEIYILSLLDEDQRSVASGGFERHWGLFTFDGQAKYNVPLVGEGSRKSLLNAQNVDYLSARWCVVDNSKDLGNSVVRALEACSSADCSPLLSPGGSCSNLSWPANISYAFNCYYQQHDQSADSCDFGGLGLITTVDPSVDQCRFFVQIRTSYSVCLKGWSLTYWIVLSTSLASIYLSRFAH
ncbi:hypothetical protein Nepgr_000031 [Nepenthes gracilis]|uniref:X8 domain-containing protein n=1 Tax=Nepenthes gracilis TaxID=150966 RepID=A0AAD3P5R5_NEPGR|nr:hypothetical protein Nepgr_000031 [Nepenthes gracilis]